MGKSDFTDLQWAFVNEYFKCNFNATEAAAQAGYSGDRETLAVTGSRLLKNANVAAEIQRRMDEHAMSANEVLHRLAQIARNDIAQYIQSYGTVVGIDMDAIREAGLVHLISEVNNTDNGPRIKFTDSQRALETLAKVHQLTTTSKVQIEDWRSQAIEDIRAGKIEYYALAEAFDDDLATELFRRAGVSVEVKQDQEAEAD